MKTLTMRQRKVYEFIKTHKYFPPTYREIGHYFGISVKGAYDHVGAIIKKGYLTRDYRKARTIHSPIVPL